MQANHIALGIGNQRDVAILSDGEFFLFHFALESAEWRGTAVSEMERHPPIVGGPFLPIPVGTQTRILVSSRPGGVTNSTVCPSKSLTTARRPHSESCGSVTISAPTSRTNGTSPSTESTLKPIRVPDVEICGVLVGLIRRF